MVICNILLFLEEFAQWLYRAVANWFPTFLTENLELADYLAELFMVQFAI